MRCKISCSGETEGNTLLRRACDLFGGKREKTAMLFCESDLQLASERAFPADGGRIFEWLRTVPRSRKATQRDATSSGLIASGARIEEG